MKKNNKVTVAATQMSCSWEIDENSKSVYKIRDDKLADSVLKTK